MELPLLNGRFDNIKIVINHTKMVRTTFVALVFLLLCQVPLTAQPANNNDPIIWVGMERALQLAENNGKKILIDVYAEWCPYCQRMQDEVYPDRTVKEAVNEYFIPVRINIESQESLRYLGRTYTEEEFSRALQYQSVPTTYFMNERGEIVGQQPGLLPVEIFTDLLEFVGTGAFEEQSFDEFQRNRDS